MANRMFRVEMQGLRELERALAQLPKATAKSALRTALKKAGQPVLSAAAAAAPRDTGQLAASIEIKSTLSRRQRRGHRPTRGGVDMYIGATSKGAHAHLLEFGTVHMRARPFLRPAWDAHKDEVLRSFAGHAWRLIERAARRLARRAARMVR